VRSSERGRIRQPGDRLFEHTVPQRRPRRTRSFSVTGPLGFLFVMLWCLFCLAWPITVVVILLHFVLKYW
jgi:hypothetical protein